MSKLVSVAVCTLLLASSCSSKNPVYTNDTSDGDTDQQPSDDGEASTAPRSVAV